MQISNFIWNQFGMHLEMCSNTLNAHSEIPDKVFRIIHSEIPSSSWNFYTRAAYVFSMAITEFRTLYGRLKCKPIVMNTLIV
jgi:hypothetical protein